MYLGRKQGYFEISESDISGIKAQRATVEVSDPIAQSATTIKTNLSKLGNLASRIIQTSKQKEIVYVDRE